MASNQELLDKVESFQNLLISYATGGSMDAAEYQRERNYLLEALGERLPRFVRVNRSLHQLWPFFKKTSATYQGRREFIWGEFSGLLNQLEHDSSAPVDSHATETLAVLSSDTVHSAWRTALERRLNDPEGAITAARTLLETVCKHMLDDWGTIYDPAADLPTLYRLTAEGLQLAPSQQTEPIFRQILGGCASVVAGLGAMRNKLGDAHGKGRSATPATERHAELAVNLAGAAATFLVQTWESVRAA